MDVEEFRDFCLSLSGSSEKMPFERFLRGRSSILAFYVRGHIFCYFDLDRFDRCTLKCAPERIDELKDRYEAVGPPYNGDRRSWVSVRFNDDMPDGVLKELVRDAHRIVASRVGHSRS